MKKLTVVFSVLLAALLLAVPTFAQEEDRDYESITAEDLEGTTVTFWHQHGGQREEQLNEIIADFNENNEYGITVEPSNQGGYGDIFTKMTTVLAGGGGELPNLVVAYQNQAATYELADGLVDMRPLVNSDKWGLSEEAQDDFFRSFFNQDVFPSFDGQRLGFPPNRSMEVMYYNIEWLNELREAGAISFDGPPTTPEQFREAACAATENPFSGATGENEPIGYQLSMDASRFASWTFAHGGDVFDYEDSEYNYDNEHAVEAMTYLRGLFDDGCAGEIFEQYGDQANFGAGTTLFTVGSSSGLPFYRSAVNEGADFEWSVAAVPHTTEEPVQNIYGASVSIGKTTPAEEVATWLFIKYYTSPEAQARWARASNYFPVRASVADGLDDYFEENEAYESAFELLEYARAEPPVPNYDVVRDEVEVVMNALVTRQDDREVEVILEELNQFANEELELAMEGMEME